MIDGLKDSLSYLNKDVEDLKNENQFMNRQMKLIKEGNLCLAEKVVKVQKNERALSIRVNQKTISSKETTLKYKVLLFLRTKIKKILKKLPWLS